MNLPLNVKSVIELRLFLLNSEECFSLCGILWDRSRVKPQGHKHCPGVFPLFGLQPVLFVNLPFGYQMLFIQRFDSC